MIKNSGDGTGIPEWYLETFHVLQHVDGSLRNLEIELREATEISDLDERVRAQMQTVLEAFQGLKGNLALVDMTATDVLDQVLVQAA